MSLERKQPSKNKLAYSAKECAYLAAFVSLVIALQFVFSFVPGVELVTALLISYSFTMGVRRGMLAATAFSLLRQLVFGFSPTVLILYLLYYNLLTLLFGGIGHKVKRPVKALPWLTVLASLCTVCFTLLDNLITPLWYAYTAKAAKLYFYASLPFMLPQVVCTAVSVFCLLLPLRRAFLLFKK